MSDDLHYEITTKGVVAITIMDNSPLSINKITELLPTFLLEDIEQAIQDLILNKSIHLNDDGTLKFLKL